LVAAVNAAVNVWQQRKQLREQLGEQREQLERQLMAQREQLERQLAAQREQLERQLGVAREGQQTERFTRAVEQLGDDKPAVRLGGIYALGQIAKASERDRRAIYEVLTAFVQLHAPWPPRRRDQPAEHYERKDLPELREWAPDVQAAMNVVARRTFEPDVDNRLRLVAVDLRRALLRGANLQEATFRDACLHRAVLAGAHLQDALLLGTRLEDADLQNAELTGAEVEDANLESCDCRGARLGDVDLSRTRLTGARFEGATETSSTKWPDQFNARAHGVIREDRA
jgi:hypothetical protein